MSKIIVKPCPFCGGKADLCSFAFLHVEAFIKCKKCGCRTLTYKGQDYEDVKYLAVTAWNRREADE
ncbi:Lar family restriction alleviation protein [Bariatricus sp. SGI.161]|uniref:Lar family restriction alleviation protein n=1 Tax=Bariatricus sp. SGI.161 TaxID=3420550 RepID=UPI003D059939